MMSSTERRHLFISHHHKDDTLVDNFVSLLGKKGWDVRNSSIRAKPANQERIDKGLVKPETIRRLLRMKISWASTVVVLVGSETHARPWVNWEIDQAHAQGKRIVGVFEHGGKDADLPASLQKYASSIVAWHSESIQRAIDGGEVLFQNSDGSDRAATGRVTSQC
jgi:hypothetical protein